MTSLSQSLLHLSTFFLCLSIFLSLHLFPSLASPATPLRSSPPFPALSDWVQPWRVHLMHTNARICPHYMQSWRRSPCRRVPIAHQPTPGDPHAPGPRAIRPRGEGRAAPLIVARDEPGADATSIRANSGEIRRQRKVQGARREAWGKRLLWSSCLPSLLVSATRPSF